MFGHDNQSNDDNPGQITLPSTEELDKDIPATPTAFSPQADIETPDDLKAATDVLTAADAIVAGASTHDTPAAAASAPTDVPADELLDIKQDVLKALTPLVDQLEQSPEEKFRTTMMLIQASDNHSLIKTAYDAAQGISSEKERAQALLDIVNEINYFTQNTPSA